MLTPFLTDDSYIDFLANSSDTAENKGPVYENRVESGHVHKALQMYHF